MPEGRRTEELLRNGLSEELLRQYIAYIERQLGTTVNAEALRRVAGGEAF
jgi:peptidyl-prolyl cis-trans isomerase D